MRNLITTVILAVLLGMSLGLAVETSVKAGGECDQWGFCHNGTDPREPDLVYVEIRGNLEETEIRAHGVPAVATIPIGARTGVFKGYVLPIWSDPANVNEELYFSVCVPDRWDGENDICIEVVSALDTKGEGNNAYRLHIETETVEPNAEIVPDLFFSRDSQRNSPLSNLQYFCYRDWFEIDVAALGIQTEDVFSFRLQRIGALAPATDNLTGDLIILHVGILFPRGDLLGDPDDIITEEDMEELMIQVNVVVDILEGWDAFFLLLFGLIFVIGLSTLAFWKYNALLFMLAGGAALILGFAWYDAFTITLGLAIGVLLMTYGVVCMGFAFACIFRRERVREEE